MARRPRVFAPGILYHVIVRGNHRRDVFRDEPDRVNYLERAVDQMDKILFGEDRFHLLTILSVRDALAWPSLPSTSQK